MVSSTQGNGDLAKHGAQSRIISLTASLKFHRIFNAWLGDVLATRMWEGFESISYDALRRIKAMSINLFDG
jgi:hypothetical protein